MISYKLMTRQDNGVKVRGSINIVHDKGGNSEQVKVISFMANEKGLWWENQGEAWQYPPMDRSRGPTQSTLCPASSTRCRTL